MNTQNIYGSLDLDEITEIIIASPTNLVEFFDNSIIIQDSNLPYCGIPLGRGVSFAALEERKLTRLEAMKMIKSKK